MKKLRFWQLSETAKANAKSILRFVFDGYISGIIADAVDTAKVSLPNGFDILDYDVKETSARIEYQTVAGDTITVSVSEENQPYVSMDISDTFDFFKDDLSNILDTLVSATEEVYRFRCADYDKEFDYFIEDLDAWFDETGEEYPDE